MLKLVVVGAGCLVSDLVAPLLNGLNDLLNNGGLVVGLDGGKGVGGGGGGSGDHGGGSSVGSGGEGSVVGGGGGDGSGLPASSWVRNSFRLGMNSLASATSAILYFKPLASLAATTGGLSPATYS